MNWNLFSLPPPHPQKNQTTKTLKVRFCWTLGHVHSGLWGLCKGPSYLCLCNLYRILAEFQPLSLWVLVHVGTGASLLPWGDTALDVVVAGVHRCCMTGRYSTSPKKTPCSNSLVQSICAHNVPKQAQIITCLWQIKFLVPFKKKISFEWKYHI